MLPPKLLNRRKPRDEHKMSSSVDFFALPLHAFDLLTTEANVEARRILLVTGMKSVQLPKEMSTAVRTRLCSLAYKLQSSGEDANLF